MMTMIREADVDGDGQINYEDNRVEYNEAEVESTSVVNGTQRDPVMEALRAEARYMETLTLREFHEYVVTLLDYPILCSDILEHPRRLPPIAIAAFRRIPR